MAEAPGLIEARELTKRFGDKVAVDHLSFAVEPGNGLDPEGIRWVRTFMRQLRGRAGRSSSPAT